MYTYIERNGRLFILGEGNRLLLEIKVADFVVWRERYNRDQAKNTQFNLMLNGSNYVVRRTPRGSVR